MQVFEFHFNPPKEKEISSGHAKSIFDSFCYEPENIYEKRMGSLYMVGLFKNVLPQNVHFLDKLSKVIREKYYKTISANPEASLKEALRKTNEYLEKTAKGGDVTWLGNLNFAVLSFKNFELNFTKVGAIKILLLRKGQIIDIDEKLKFEDIEPYPLKIFGNIVSGKMAENDAILVLTKEIFETFQSQNLINQIAKLSPFEQKKLKGTLNDKKEELTKISGICFVVVLKKEVQEKEREMFLEKKTLKIFSLKEVFSPLVNLFSRAIKIPSFKFKIPQPKIKKPKVKIPPVHLPTLPKIQIKIPILFTNKNFVLIVSLILVLAFGFFIFEKKEENQLKIYQGELNQVEQKVQQAESYLIIAKNNPQAKKSANLLFKEAWQEIVPLVNIISTLPSDFANQVLQSENKISENLYQLNQLVKISEPEMIFEFNAQEFIPQKFTSFGNNLYFFSPYSQNVFEINQRKEGELIPVDKKIALVASLSDSIIFFIKPNQLINFKNGVLGETFSLGNPYQDFSFNDFSSFRSSLYFLDNKNGGITKYPYLSNFQWGAPQVWLKSEKVKNFESLAVDGSVWVLTNKNEIERYYGGLFQETLNLDIFPYPQSFSKILTSSQLSYLYILEPAEKRIIIINRSGQVIKQFQSEKFDNLLDFSVSQDGKTIWLLNGLKVYQITL